MYVCMYVFLFLPAFNYIGSFLPCSFNISVPAPLPMKIREENSEGLKPLVDYGGPRGKQTVLPHTLSSILQPLTHTVSLRL